MSVTHLATARSPPPLGGAAGRRLVWLVGCGAPVVRMVEEWLAGADSPEEILLQQMEATALASAAQQPEVVCLGPSTPALRILEAVEGLATSEGETGPAILLLGCGEPDQFRGLVERDLIFYLADRMPSTADLITLIEAALGGDLRPTEPRGIVEPSPEILRHVADIERSADLDACLEAIEVSAREIVSARRASCRLMDAENLVLWRPSPGKARLSGLQGGAIETEADSAVTGVVGFIARTGRSVNLRRLAEDPRYDAEADSSGRRGRGPWLGVALPASSSGGVGAVLVVGRGGRQPGFDPEAVSSLEALAQEAGPILRRRRLAAEHAELRRRTEVFRREALEHRDRGLQIHAQPLRITPSWLGTAYRAILGLCVAVLLALPWIRSDEIVVGPAKVRLERSSVIRAPAAGILSALEFTVGQPVEEGQVVARLESSAEEVRLRQLEGELETRLVQRLLSPAVPSAAPLAPLQESLKAAVKSRESRLMRAPHAGVMGEGLVRPGSAVVAGQPVANLRRGAGRAPRPTLEAILPGRHLPSLEAGMAMRLKLDGFDDLELDLVIDELSGQVFDQEVARGLETSWGAGVATLEDGFIVLRASMLTDTFESRGRRYALFDGMAGSVEVRLHRRYPVLDWLRGLVP